MVLLSLQLSNGLPFRVIVHQNCFLFLLSRYLLMFCKFVSNGAHEGQRFQVDPIKNAMDPGRHVYASRDYDSVLGLGKHIYLDCDVTIHPVCKLEDTLRCNIHIKHSFTNRHVRMK